MALTEEKKDPHQIIVNDFEGTVTMISETIIKRDGIELTRLQDSVSVSLDSDDDIDHKSKNDSPERDYLRKLKQKRSNK